MGVEVNNFTSSALQVNLERTAATVEIPDVYERLLAVVQSHYGVQKRTRELLIELNHPFVNWEYVLTQLKTLSIGDFYEINGHPDGFAALSTILDIYFSVVTSGSGEEIREKGLRFLFDFIDALVGKGSDSLTRNTPRVLV